MSEHKKENNNVIDLHEHKNKNVNHIIVGLYYQHEMKDLEEDMIKTFIATFEDAKQENEYLDLMLFVYSANNHNSYHKPIPTWSFSTPEYVDIFQKHVQEMIKQATYDLPAAQRKDPHIMISHDPSGKLAYDILFGVLVELGYSVEKNFLNCHHLQ
jgi:hypothetical protein